MNCKHCNKALSGRIDKKFCDSYCKSAYHNHSRSIANEYYLKIDSILKNNRRILKAYNKAGKSTIDEEVLINEGFNVAYFTHYWRNKKNQPYIFCYEYGYLRLVENNKRKMILVIWQPYMTPQQ